MNDSTYEWNIQEAKDAAILTGQRVYEGSSTQLLLDIDTDTDMRQFESIMSISCAVLQLSEVERWRSKGRFGWHVLVSCPEMSARERVMMQAVLGSDRKRAALGLMMIQDGIEEPNLLFRPAVTLIEGAK